MAENAGIRSESEVLEAAELRDAWPALDRIERLEGFGLLSSHQAERFFLSLNARSQADLITGLPEERRLVWIRVLAPDDVADVLQSVAESEREPLLGLLDPTVRREVQALLAYGEDEAGGLMNPRFVRVRPEMPADEAIRYVRLQAGQNPETLYYAYVLDESQHLIGVVSMRQLLGADPESQVREFMVADPVTLREETDQEEAAHLFARHDLVAIPVLDAEGRMQGVVTVDDIVDVFHEEATEDIQKIGGSEVLGAPYLRVGLGTMVRKRASWLVLLFLGEMLTATAMGIYEKEIQAAVVLALFIPLIISSGGNSGSQATTLLIRAMALREVRLRDWFRVFRREVATGFLLGCILGAVGFMRIMLWPSRETVYGPHYLLIATTVACSLVGIVLWGTLAGSMLPFLLRRLGLDPASASAPLVATIVDVTGLIIYFSVASLFLRGVLL